ncbi:somatomedin-B and thrombospondin type-1 domain-containing protein-like [Ochlerotatus camptorhynchus]|uniref:somatomedin-B and thrombospondin type-1 domain-containing protein-like n=1 Tax=Ochlerotatus camptorhynchus TaxID=644619 RepID=UPI0031CED1D8
MCAECLMVFPLVLSVFVVSVYGGSCREATLCCNGRDSSCVVQKMLSNAAANDLNVKPCYCDHACLKLGDCCSDFKAYCGVIDCVVSEWGPWNECDTPCGPGTTSRNRTVRQKPRNGGKHCPSLLQNRGCLGTDCHATSNRPALLQETALLLPVATLSSRRHENYTTSSGGDVIQRLQIRKNTFHAHKPTDGYCIAFLVMKVTKHCHKDLNYRALLEGDRIVVHCDLEPPFTQNITSVEQDPYENYISDESAEDADENGNTSIDDYDRNLQHHSIRKDSQRTLPDRCLGEGVTGRNTRFASLVLPSCHGKWLRLTTAFPKKCTSGEAQFIFV